MICMPMHQHYCGITTFPLNDSDLVGISNNYPPTLSTIIHYYASYTIRLKYART